MLEEPTESSSISDVLSSLSTEDWGLTGGGFLSAAAFRCWAENERGVGGMLGQHVSCKTHSMLGGQTCVYGHQLLPNNGHSAGGGGGRVEAAAVWTVGCVCAVWASVALLEEGTPVQAPALVGCREQRTTGEMLAQEQCY